MVDAGFPGQHTTTTTVTSSTSVQTNMRFDPSYIKTVPGILKIVQLVLAFIGFICIESGGHLSYLPRGNFYNTIAWIGIWFTGIMLLFYLFHVVEKFYKIPWLKIELVFCAVWTLLYLIASCLAATYYWESYTAAAFFGFCAMVAYGVDAFFKVKAVQNGELAQGERVVNKQTSKVTSPAWTVA